MELGQTYYLQNNVDSAKFEELISYNENLTLPEKLL